MMNDELRVWPWRTHLAPTFAKAACARRGASNGNGSKPLCRDPAKEKPTSNTESGFRKGERCERRQWRMQRAERINRNEQSSDSESATIEVADESPSQGSPEGAAPPLVGLRGKAHQKRILSSMYWRRSLRATRSCCMVSRSRTVTVWVSSVSKSTQMEKGVPISSWRR